jgi:hypothetical protein
MKNYLLLILFFIAIFTSCGESEPTDSDPTQEQSLEEPRGEDNVAYKWGKLALDATANDTEWFKPRPTITSRYLGLILSQFLTPGASMMIEQFRFTWKLKEDQRKNVLWRTRRRQYHMQHMEQ